MKKTILLIGGIVAALVGISAISKRNKEKEETELPPIAEPPKVENQKPLDPLSGEGLKAINTRMKSLHNSSYKGELLSNMDSNWYGGLLEPLAFCSPPFGGLLDHSSGICPFQHQPPLNQRL